MSTMRVPCERLAAAIVSAMRASRFSWKASAILMSSEASPASTLALSRPTVGTPMMSTHSLYWWKMSNSLSCATSGLSASGWLRPGSTT